MFLASGIKDSEIRDGSLGLGRVNCCGGPTEGDTAIGFYIPSGVGAEVGDVVEVRLGRSPEKEGDLGEVNQVTRVVQKRDAPGGGCRWEPQNPRLWGRVLYCDWMPQQGWAAEGPSGSIYKLNGNSFTITAPGSIFNSPGVNCSGSASFDGTISQTTTSGTISSGALTCNGVRFVLTGTFTATRQAQLPQGGARGGVIQALRNAVGSR